MHSGAPRRRAAGKGIPEATRIRTERRILDFAAQNYPGKFTRIDVRFRGAYCYIDVYTEPDLSRAFHPHAGETREQWIEEQRNIPTHLCRLRYSGDENRWVFDWYTYAHERYEPSFLITGDYQGTPEEAFATSALWF